MNFFANYAFQVYNIFLTQGRNRHAVWLINNNFSPSAYFSFHIEVARDKHDNRSTKQSF